MEQTLAEEVFRQLEADILELKIPPGTMLSENSLCERFNVSRTPVRSVLQRLQAQRLVEIAPHKGTRVTLIRYDIVSQIIYQRVATESAILRDFLPVRSPQDLVQLRHHLSLMEAERDALRAGTAPNTDRFWTADRAMHEVWYRSGRKLYLWSSLNEAKADYIRFCMLDMQGGSNYDGVLREHSELMRIVEEQDTPAVEQVVKDHFYGGVRRLGTRVYADLRSYFDPASLV